MEYIHGNVGTLPETLFVIKMLAEKCKFSYTPIILYRYYNALATTIILNPSLRKTKKFKKRTCIQQSS